MNQDFDNSNLDATLTNGEREITYFFDEREETSDYRDFTFAFLENDDATATINGVSTNGWWKTNGDDGTLELELYFGEDSPLDELDEDWDVIEFNSSLISLFNVSGGDGSIDSLVFEKK